MQAQEFQDFLSNHPAVRDTLQRAAQSVPAKSYAGAAEAALLVALFPVVRYVVMEIGLPWLATLKKFSEVQRRRVEDWIDQYAGQHGLDPDEVEAASKQLLQELEKTTDSGAQQQWERLMEMMKD